MHVLLVMFFALTASAAALGFYSSGQAQSCDENLSGQFSVCAEDGSSSQDGGSSDLSDPKMRQCRYFANGTIDVPTLTVITAWVPVGSRPCIGDTPAESSTRSGSWQSEEEIELRAKFTALATKPRAWWSPGVEVELTEPIELGVDADTEQVAGALLGKPALIRFRPVSVRWEVSDGAALYGFRKSHSFDAPGTYLARAHVKYEVDYQYAHEGWVFSAARWELGSNKVSIPVIERQRRTLLVG